MTTSFFFLSAIASLKVKYIFSYVVFCCKLEVAFLWSLFPFILPFLSASFELIHASILMQFNPVKFKNGWLHLMQTIDSLEKIFLPLKFYAL